MHTVLAKKQNAYMYCTCQIGQKRQSASRIVSWSAAPPRLSRARVASPYEEQADGPGYIFIYRIWRDARDRAAGRNERRGRGCGYRAGL